MNDKYVVCTVLYPIGKLRDFTSFDKKEDAFAHAINESESDIPRFVLLGKDDADYLPKVSNLVAIALEGVLFKGA